MSAFGFVARQAPGLYTRTWRHLDWTVRKRAGHSHAKPWRVMLNGKHFANAATLTVARRIIRAREKIIPANERQEIAGVVELMYSDPKKKPCVCCPGGRHRYAVAFSVPWMISCTISCCNTTWDGRQVRITVEVVPRP